MPVPMPPPSTYGVALLVGMSALLAVGLLGTATYVVGLVVLGFGLATAYRLPWVATGRGGN